MGVALFRGFVMLVGGYLLWVIVVVTLFALSGWIKRGAGVLAMLALAVAPLLALGLWVHREGVRDSERQSVEKINLAAAAKAWPAICAAPATVKVFRAATKRQPEVLIKDAQEERDSTYADIAVSRAGIAAVYPGSPFTTAMERVAIRADDPLCKDNKPGYQCKNPTHGYRVWRGKWEPYSGVQTPKHELHFALEFTELKPTSESYIQPQTITLTEDGVVLASGTVNYNWTAPQGTPSFCPDREQMVRSIIAAAFPEPATAQSSEP
jgi:hypothetical protein